MRAARRAAGGEGVGGSFGRTWRVGLWMRSRLAGQREWAGAAKVGGTGQGADRGHRPTPPHAQAKGRNRKSLGCVTFGDRGIRNGAGSGGGVRWGAYQGLREAATSHGGGHCSTRGSARAARWAAQAVKRSEEGSPLATDRRFKEALRGGALSGRRSSACSSKGRPPLPRALAPAPTAARWALRDHAMGALGW